MNAQASQVSSNAPTSSSGSFQSVHFSTDESALKMGYQKIAEILGLGDIDRLEVSDIVNAVNEIKLRDTRINASIDRFLGNK